MKRLERLVITTKHDHETKSCGKLLCHMMIFCKLCSIITWEVDVVAMPHSDVQYIIFVNTSRKGWGGEEGLTQ